MYRLGMHNEGETNITIMYFTNLFTLDGEKLQHRSGIDLGLWSPILRLPDSLPLHNWIRSSPISLRFFGSSKLNGKVDFVILSIHKLSEVALVFIKWLTSFCPQMDRAHWIAVDLPGKNNWRCDYTYSYIDSVF